MVDLVPELSSFVFFVLLQKNLDTFCALVVLSLFFGIFWTLRRLLDLVSVLLIQGLDMDGQSWET